MLRRYAAGGTATARAVVLLIVIPAVLPAQDVDSRAKNLTVGSLATGGDADSRHGTFRTSVPITIPPGARGIQPSLAFRYSSGSGGGDAGKGWSLGLSTIARNGHFGAHNAQVVALANAAFVLDGTRLVKGLVDPATGCRRYYTEVDNFTKTLLCNGTNDSASYWSITTKDGTRSTYGARPGANSKLVVGGRAFEYYLDEVTDTHGLSWRATYSAYGDAGSGSAPRLESISYTFRNAAPLDEERIIEVQWEARPDGQPESVSYLYGFPLSGNRRVAAVVVSLGTQLVRTYELVYAASPDSSASLLQSIRVLSGPGHDFLSATRFTYQFNHASPTIFSTTATPVANPAEMTKPWPGDTKCGDIVQDLMDIDGDGDLDRVVAWERRPGGTAKAYYLGGPDGDPRPRYMVYKYSPSSGFATTAVPWYSPAADRPLVLIRDYLDAAGSCAAVGPRSLTGLVIDINGDGLPDLFSNERVFENTGSAFREVAWTDPVAALGFPPEARSRTASHSSCPAGVGPTNAICTIDQTRSTSLLQDGDGDGCPDRFRYSRSHWLFHRNQACDPVPVRAFAPGVVWDWHGAVPADYLGKEASLSYRTCNFQVVPPSCGGSTHVATYYHGMADLNGDRLTDFRTDTGTTYLGTGRGFLRQQPGITTFRGIAESALRGDGYRAGARSRLVDINGDGLLDIVNSSTLLSDAACLSRCAAQEPACDLYEYARCNGGGSRWSVVKNTGVGFASSPVELTEKPEWRWLQKNVHGAEMDPGDLRNCQFGWHDLDGSGTPDLVMNCCDAYAGSGTSYGCAAGGWTMSLFKNTGPAPDLLRTIEPQSGGRITVSYKAITSGHSGVGGNLNSVRVVVDSVESDDGFLNRVRSTYTYRHPYVDRGRREFLGFGFVGVAMDDFDATTTDPHTETIYANGNPRRLIFDTPDGQSGTPYCTIENVRDGFALAGLPVFSRYGTGHGLLLQQEVFTRWRIVTSGPVKAVRKEFERTASVGGTAPNHRRWKQVNYAYDAYGNVTKVLDLGESRFASLAVCSRNNPAGCSSDTTETSCAIDTSYQADEVYTLNVYAQDVPSWRFATCQSRVCSDATCATPTSLLAHAQTIYDDLPLCQVSAGDVTERRSLIRYAGEADRWSSTLLRYDPNGNVSQNRIKLSDAPAWATTDFTWTASGAHLKGEATTVALGKPTPLTLRTLRDWDERFGVVQESADANARVLRYDHDSHGRLIRTRSSPPDDPAGPLVLLSEVSYRNDGVVAYPQASHNSVRRREYPGADPSAYAESYAYFDGLDRLVQTKTRADDAGVVKWVTVNQGYRSHGPTRETLPYYTSSPDYTHFEFDVTPPAQPVRKTAYDQLGRVRSTRLLTPAGGEKYVVTTSISDVLWTRTVTDPAGNRTTYSYDADDKVIGVSNRDNANPVATMATTAYAYDRLGNLTTVTDDAGNVIRTAYDSAGRRRKLVDGDLSNCSPASSCPWLFSYDLAGRLTGLSNAKGEQITYAVDELGRTYLKDHGSPGEADVRYDFDAGPNALARPTRVAQGSRHHSLGYDNWGRVLTDTRNVVGVDRTSSFTYDLADRQTTLHYPNGERVSYQYDPDGRLESVRHHLADGSAKAVISAIDYDALGRSTRILWGNKLRTLSSYSSDHQKLASRSVQDAAGSAVLTDISYTYNEDGNVLEVQENAAGHQWRREHSYDWADRLTGARHHVFGPAGWALEKSWAYAYNPIGNMTYHSEAGALSYGGAGPHAVTGVGPASVLAYDPNGAVTDNSGRTYSYDADGRATSIADTGGTSLGLEYLDGSRVRKQSKGAGAGWDIGYYGDHYQESVKDGVPSNDRYVLAGGVPVAYLTDRQPGTLFFIHSDTLGSVGLVTDLSGVEIERRIYGPFGGIHLREVPAPAADPGLRLGYTGEDEDAETGQVHLGVRQYEPTLGRFLSPDSVVDALHVPQRLNRYGYALNNPAKYVDPSGYRADLPMTKLDQHGAIAGAGLIAMATCNGAGCSGKGLDAGVALMRQDVILTAQIQRILDRARDNALALTALAEAYRQAEQSTFERELSGKILNSVRAQGQAVDADSTFDKFVTWLFTPGGDGSTEYERSGGYSGEYALGQQEDVATGRKVAGPMPVKTFGGEKGKTDALAQAFKLQEEIECAAIFGSDRRRHIHVSWGTWWKPTTWHFNYHRPEPLDTGHDPHAVQ